MTDWIAYHSQKTVGHSYASVSRHSVYSKTTQKKLCFGDVIWVIEGSNDIPTQYTLVDCFRYAETEYPPFLPPYDGFETRIIGKESLLAKPVALDMTVDWQVAIRDRFLTKHRFFVSLGGEAEIVAGLQALAG